MSRASAAPVSRPSVPRPIVSRPIELTDNEAITLRRIAFSESDIRFLRRADVDRLLRLRLVAEARNDLVLTTSGKDHFDSLPRPLLCRQSAPAPRPAAERAAAERSIPASSAPAEVACSSFPRGGVLKGRKEGSIA